MKNLMDGEAVWYFAMDEKAVGPFCWKDLQLKMLIHHLNDQTLVWQPIFKTWRPLVEVKKELNGYGRSEFSWISDEIVVSSASLNPEKAIALAKIDTEGLAKKSPYFKENKEKLNKSQNEDSKFY